MYWRDRNITSFAPFLEAIQLLLKMAQKFWKTCIRPFYSCLLRADLHATIFVASLRQAYDTTYDCRSVLKHFSDVHTNRKSCRRQKSDRVNRPLVACLLNESEAGGDLVLIETSLLFLC